ncbi:hypothetical protein BH23ACT11_BH23ACT11_23820 [soil metagenome]
MTTLAPWVLFSSTIALFMVPGLVLSYIAPGRSYPMSARIPLAFTLSVFLYGLPAVPALTLHWSLGTYLLVCAAILLTAVVLAMVMALRRRMPPEGLVSFTAGSVGRWLMWAPFLILLLVLTVISATGTMKVGDEWIYLAYVQDFVSNANRLAAHEPFYGSEASFTRIQMSGWLLEHATFSRVSGIEPVSLTLDYLPPVLTAVALIAFYPFARALLEDARAALLATILNALLPIYSYLLGFFPIPYNTLFFITITMDKVAVRYIFLPVALALTVWFLRERGLRYLVLFALLCWSVMLVHPIGLVVICFALAGLGLGYLAFNWREWPAWARLASLALGPLAVVLPVTAYVLATGTSLIELRGSISNYYPTDPSAIGYMAFTQGRILELADGSFILNPNNLLMWLTVLAYLGIPFLVWKARNSLVARMLLGAMVFITPLVFVPPLATFVGTYIGPSQLLRLHWVIELAVPVILGWMLWELIEYLGNRLSWFRAARSLVPFLPPAAAIVLVAGALYYATPSINTHLARNAGSAGSKATMRTSCTHPVYRWLDKTITTPSVVLARSNDNTCIPVYSANANLVDVRGGVLITNEAVLERVTGQEIEISRRAVDVRQFATTRTVDEELISILKRYEVDYVLVGKPPLARDIDERIKSGSSGFTRMAPPGKGYAVYEVNLQELEASR